MGADDGLCCKASPGYHAEIGHSRTGIPGTWRKVEGHKVDLGMDAGCEEQGDHGLFQGLWLESLSGRWAEEDCRATWAGRPKQMPHCPGTRPEHRKRRMTPRPFAHRKFQHQRLGP